MSEPINHHSKFPEGWWNERRRRDYFVDGDGLVRLRPDSPTADKLGESLREAAELLATPAQGTA
jgi:hypothetical protein